MQRHKQKHSLCVTLDYIQAICFIQANDIQYNFQKRQTYYFPLVFTVYELYISRILREDVHTASPLHNVNDIYVLVSLLLSERYIFSQKLIVPLFQSERIVTKS
ncbi:Hypothetical_protein [Hexamita inflata]|uniref:Hypothetical_protein n=1 Tax=Hexamita inflata TaxID=28002 RepID=A0AA86Q1E9_9EUKA|nr:Hypothetical protein HINF_LOCUS31269 [Hexamita inflata]